MTPQEFEAIVAQLRDKTDLEVHQELAKLSFPPLTHERVVETLRKSRQRDALNAVVAADDRTLDAETRDALNSLLNRKEPRQ